ncbi:MAG: formate--tetrahydrofolate ligase [Christensenellaceae bacterium]|nr:formate--tetrahydrofolate ligase [Christensenellaceae bacterium]
MYLSNDLQIAQKAQLKPIVEIAKKLNIDENQLSMYGKYIAKLDVNSIKDKGNKAKLILVTAMHPTPAGEGKTTISVGLADGLQYIGKKAMIALREPSLGPVFGIKGGATGGGLSQVLPMENINLHFTGDLHAITAANNLLAAMIDNHIQQGNQLQIDPREVTWHRCLDVNDRQLRQIISGLGGNKNGVPRQDSFVITAASQIMATFCLSSTLEDLKQNLSNLVIGKTFNGEFVTAGQLNAAGAMTVLLKDAFAPNLVQTIEGTPCLMHGGPFANIAHGCNSIIATKTAMNLADYVVTEAGFGADLGAEKFIDIKCRKADIFPNAVVIVATIRALKYHGGAKEYNVENLDSLKEGTKNLIAHVQRVKAAYNIPVVVALNKFYMDTEAEIDLLKAVMLENNIPCEISNAYVEGGKGAQNLAQTVLNIIEENSSPKPQYAYDLNIGLKAKIETLAKKIYGADNVVYTANSNNIINDLEERGFGNLPICVAKTQYSFSDDAKKLNCPKGFEITVKNLELSSGAGFVVVYTGDIIAMPGLPKVPAANNINIDENGNTIGLF